MKTPPPPPIGYISEAVYELFTKCDRLSDHALWLVDKFGIEQTQYVQDLYGMTHSEDGRVIFWQRDYEGRLRTGKIMAYDPTTGKRLKGDGSIGWVHSDLKREGILPEDWRLEQCLYGEHLLKENPDLTVALVEAYKTAHIGAILLPQYLWLATDSMMGLTEERLRHLKGRHVLLFPDEGKGREEWSARIDTIAEKVGFRYAISEFSLRHNGATGDDIVDIVEREE